MQTIITRYRWNGSTMVADAPTVVDGRPNAVAEQWVRQNYGRSLMTLAHTYHGGKLTVKGPDFPRFDWMQFEPKVSNPALSRLHHHTTRAVERGDKTAIVEIPTTAVRRARFADALKAFKDATAELSRAWDDVDGDILGDTYSLPKDFTEVARDIADWEIVDATRYNVFQRWHFDPTAIGAELERPILVARVYVPLSHYGYNSYGCRVDMGGPDTEQRS